MFPDWLEELAKRGCALEDRLDAIRHKLRRRSGGGELQVLPYRGFGNEREVNVHGRVLLKTENPPVSGGRLQNALATYRRFASQEVPGCAVRIEFEGSVVESISNREGYFRATLHNPNGVGTDLQRPAEYTVEGARATGKIYFATARSRFGVISDIDDTVLISHATHLVKMAVTLLLNDARGRLAFPGVSAFYRALHSSAENPFFYVSSGPWNLYDLLVDFFELHRLPPGPILLQDYGLERDRFLCATHHTHKLEQIERLLRTYPNLPFVLIGDSGQQDPEIYARVLEEVPNRIPAVYIRDVSGDKRDAEVRRLCEAAKARGSELVFVRDSVEAAWHAAERGFIPASALDEIASDAEKDFALARGEAPLNSA